MFSVAGIQGFHNNQVIILEEKVSSQKIEYIKNSNVFQMNCDKTKNICTIPTYLTSNIQN